MGHNQALRVGQFSMQILGQFWMQINILPFACALIGRLLLETREMLKPDVRYK